MEDDSLSDLSNFAQLLSRISEIGSDPRVGVIAMPSRDGMSKRELSPRMWGRSHSLGSLRAKQLLRPHLASHSEHLEAHSGSLPKSSALTLPLSTCPCHTGQASQAGYWDSLSQPFFRVKTQALCPDQLWEAARLISLLNISPLLPSFLCNVDYTLGVLSILWVKKKSVVRRGGRKWISRNCFKVPALSA